MTRRYFILPAGDSEIVGEITAEQAERLSAAGKDDDIIELPPRVRDLSDDDLGLEAEEDEDESDDESDED